MSPLNEIRNIVIKMGFVRRYRLLVRVNMSWRWKVQPTSL